MVLVAPPVDLVDKVTMMRLGNARTASRTLAADDRHAITIGAFWRVSPEALEAFGRGPRPVGG